MDQDSEGYVKIKKSELENIVDKRVKEILSEKDTSEDKRKDSLTRRDFLKKVGLGAAGLGAIGLAPAASQLKLTKNGIFGSTGQNQQISNLEAVNSSKINANKANISKSYIDNLALRKDRIDDLNYITDQVSVSSSSSTTIFDVSGTVDILHGTVYGFNATHLKITWDDGTTDTIFSSRARADTQTDNGVLTLMPVPPIQGVSKLEIRNDDSSNGHTMAWRIITM